MWAPPKWPPPPKWAPPPACPPPPPPPRPPPPRPAADTSVAVKSAHRAALVARIPIIRFGIILFAMANLRRPLRRRVLMSIPAVSAISAPPLHSKLFRPGKGCCHWQLNLRKVAPHNPFKSTRPVAAVSRQGQISGHSTGAFLDGHRLDHCRLGFDRRRRHRGGPQ